MNRKDILLGEDLHLTQCIRCHHWWATNSSRRDENRHTKYIYRFCPVCIPHISHQLTQDPPQLTLATPA